MSIRIVLNREINGLADSLEYVGRRMNDKDEKSTKGSADLAADNHIRYQWALDNVSKFRLFFAGLVFAILSFSIQFAIQTTDRVAWWCQLLSWVALMVTGMLALRDAGGLVARNTEKAFEGVKPRVRRLMWACFILGMVLLGATRLLSEFTRYPTDRPLQRSPTPDRPS